ncbi:PTS glucitol/sorbitol transporter subunit IIA [Metabacillus niabensis]|uniref:PTS system glucitol/sorbitol-specific IIA component n=2 Tax=Metabacillus niabensis TaxID=324854 RepID=A0ABT9YVN2_9BACI|nr:PTS glucitol/sorbitol transporter subunit IIA [Metabacillus niabensis]MDQ0224052.1 PTS system glucitol/sorbitol-specific IIA component [Metabacillus niabensis]PAD70417.1 PTS sorbitol transporter subunit IIA [Bacillus sp. 7586-K]
MQTKFETQINKIGPSVSDFLGEKMLILFGENAPAELAEYCLLIDVNAVEDDIKVGDTLQLGNNEYRITAVGDAVKKNLSSLGHITLKFDGSKTPELPGTLYLEETEIKEVKIGDKIQIFS